MNFAIEAAGWLGALLILGSYILVSTGRLSGQSRAFQWMNVAGCAGLCRQQRLAWGGAFDRAQCRVVRCRAADAVEPEPTGMI